MDIWGVFQAEEKTNVKAIRSTFAFTFENYKETTEAGAHREKGEKQMSKSREVGEWHRSYRALCHCKDTSLYYDLRESTETF